jgi:hypothetical protein
MRAITSKAIWFFTGVFVTHVAHFIYQQIYAGNFTGIKFSEAIAMFVEDLIQLLVRFLDAVLPVLVSSQQLILGVLVAVIGIIVSFVWLKIYFAVKRRHQYDAKIKEAETVLTTAKKRAAVKLQKIETLKIKLNAEFARKETSLQNELKEKIKGYLMRIKTLEREQMELKAINGDLMQKLKTN